MIGRFAATGILPKFNEKLVAAGIRLPVEMFDEMVDGGAGNERSDFPARPGVQHWLLCCWSPVGGWRREQRSAAVRRLTGKQLVKADAQPSQRTGVDADGR